MKTLRNTPAALALALAVAMTAAPLAGAAGTVDERYANALAERYSDAIKEMALTSRSKEETFEQFCRLMNETFDLEYMTAYTEKEASMGGVKSVIGQKIALGYIAAWSLYKMSFLKEHREKNATLQHVPVGQEGTRKHGSVRLVTFKVRNAADADVSEIYIGANGKIRNFGNSMGTILGNAPAELRPGPQAGGGESSGGLNDNLSPIEAAKKYIVDTVGKRYAAGCP